MPKKDLNKVVEQHTGGGGGGAREGSRDKEEQGEG